MHTVNNPKANKKREFFVPTCQVGRGIHRSKYRYPCFYLLNSYAVVRAFFGEEQGFCVFPLRTYAHRTHDTR